MVWQPAPRAALEGRWQLHRVACMGARPPGNPYHAEPRLGLQMNSCGWPQTAGKEWGAGPAASPPGRCWAVAAARSFRPALQIPEAVVYREARTSVMS